MSSDQKEKPEKITVRIRGEERGREASRRGSVFLRKFRRTIRKLDTQGIREDAVENLRELAEEAYEKAKPRQGRKAEQSLRWARITAYVYQVINSITREYDEKEIKETLEELKEKVARELEKGNQQDQERPREDKSAKKKNQPPKK